MKLVFASDSFKGTISSEKTVELLTKAAHEVFGPCETIGVPVADGGEGTTDAVVLAANGKKAYATVHGPLMEEVKAYYGIIDKDKAVLEMAQASGLPMVPEELRNPLNTTTYGTGELVLAAVNAGHTDISIAIGGSATNDGGMGFASALGVKFLDADGNVLEGKGSELEKVADIDMSGIPESIRCATSLILSAEKTGRPTPSADKKAARLRFSTAWKRACAVTAMLSSKSSASTRTTHRAQALPAVSAQPSRSSLTRK